MRIVVLPIMLLLFAGLAPAFAAETQGAKRADEGQVTPNSQSQRRAGDHMDRMSRDHMGRLLEHRDWDHRKAGRDWRLRHHHENVERY